MTTTPYSNKVVPNEIWVQSARLTLEPVQTALPRLVAMVSALAAEFRIMEKTKKPKR
ncbi:phosphopantothenoylcysteine decarboxylase/phosph opantothenate/cysteine ligase [Lactiplantibacillus plantarum]|nr:phosphopantothenoylcysteine decarboxylase/phosph opantothenate/cysteine ligase [Lactiplantibacillus plantarum]